MIKEAGRQFLTDYDKTILLELSQKYKEYPLCSSLHNFESDVMINWPDLTPLITVIVDDEDLSVARRLYFSLIRQIAQQLYEESTIEVDRILVIASDELSESLLIPQIVWKLMERNLNAERVGTILSEFNCPPMSLIRLKNPKITEAYLKLRNPVETFLDCQPIFQIIVKNVDIHHFELFLNHAPDFCRGETYYLLDALINNLYNLHKSEAGQSLVKMLFRYDIFNETTLEDIEYILMHASKENIEVFLAYEFRTRIKYKLDGCDVLACVFGNRDLAVLELLKNVEININNARGHGDLTPLHFALKANATESVRMLLARGANPNALDCLKNTPLESALCWRSDRTEIIDAECVKLVLVAGTDLLNYQIFNKRCWNFFGIELHEVSQNRRSYLNVIDLLAAQLALLEELNLPVEEPLAKYRSFQRYGIDGNYYVECKNQLEKLKSHAFRDSRKFSMFALLSQRPQKIARYINEEDQSRITIFMQKYATENLLIPLYYETLQKRIEVAKRLSPIIHATKRALSECMKISDENHLIIEKIVSYLNFQIFH